MLVSQPTRPLPCIEDAFTFHCISSFLVVTPGLVGDTLMLTEEESVQSDH